MSLIKRIEKISFIDDKPAREGEYKLLKKEIGKIANKTIKKQYSTILELKYRVRKIVNGEE